MCQQKLVLSHLSVKHIVGYQTLIQFNRVIFYTVIKYSMYDVILDT